LGVPGQKLIDSGECTIEHCHGKAVLIDVQRQIPAHDGQPDQSDVSLHIRYPLCSWKMSM